MSAASRHGGSPILRVGTWGPEVRAALGEPTSSPAIRGDVRDRSGGAVRCDLVDLEASDLTELVNEIADARLDVLIVSPSPAVIAATSVGHGIDALGAVVDRAKNCATWVLAANGSSAIPPSGDATNDRSMRGRIQDANLALMELSVEAGISILDVDRLLAEFGAAGRVVAPFVYTEDIRRALCTLTVDVLEDYGFFADRPLLEQRGRGAAAPPAG